MPSMGSGAVEGLQDVLARLFLEAQFKQKQQEHQDSLAMQTRSLDQGDRRIGLDERQLTQQGEQFGQRLGLDQDKLGFEKEQFTAEAPNREADLKYKGALTGELIRKPTAEQQDREFTSGRDKTLHGYRMGEINARSGDSRASDWQIVQSVDPKTNQTVSVRVNRQTGQALPVDMGGLQPGGARQTRLSAGQQDDLATMETVQGLSQQATQLGESLGWKGVGGLGAGTVGQLGMKHLGVGDPKEEQLRNFIGNIQGTIAKLRGGTAFSAQEKAMLDSYTPTINDSAPQIKAKLASLEKFITLKRDATLKFAGSPQMGAQTGAPPPPSAGGDAAARAAELIKKYGGGQ